MHQLSSYAGSQKRQCRCDLEAELYRIAFYLIVRGRNNSRSSIVSIIPITTMVKIFNPLFLCGALLVVKITPSYAQGLIVQRSGVAGARFGQGSGSRSGLGRGCCCYEEPEPPTVPERKVCKCLIF
jgi:hypothetical protein